MFRYCLLLSALVCSFPAHAHHDCAPASATTINELAENHRAILVGELHGTKEMPAAFLSVVDDATYSGRSVVIAIEHKATMQDQIDQIFASTTSQEVEQKFEEFSTKDGRSSEAMKSLMVGIWSLIVAGRNIKVAGVDYWWGDDPEDDQRIPPWIAEEVDAKVSLRDVRMGQNAIAACAAHECELLLFFAGSFHTNTEISLGGMWNAETETFERMLVAPAGHVISHEYSTASIFLTHRGGAFSANIGNGLQSNSTGSNTGKFVENDLIPYCTYGPSRSHQYVMSVGTISSSIDQSD